MNKLGQFILDRPALIPVTLFAGMIALPLVVWQDLLAVTDQTLRRQSIAMDTVVSGVRSYYSQNVISRLNPDGSVTARHDYHDTDGAIPIPATMAIELGEIIEDSELHAHFRFVSDYPFPGRTDQILTATEEEVLRLFRDGDTRDHIFRRGEHDTLLNHAIDMISPIRMEQGCVDCHNTHSDSPKTDWQVGDIRGVQSIVINQPVAASILAFKWLLSYMVIFGTAGILFSRMQFRMSARVRAMNDELAGNNEFLAGISMKLSRYLSPQIYRSIFSGEKDVELSTERKKLTVFC
ncbi:MAG: Tll0287-like domain-containing protein [Paracoccaceae bacterium]